MSHGGDDAPHEEHEEHVNHEAWVIPYADLLTLLMAMFIALFAMSTVDMTKFKALAVGFNEALGGGKLDAGVGGAAKDTSPAFGQGNGKGPLSGMPSLVSTNDQLPKGTTLAQVLAALGSSNSFSAAKAQERASLADVAKKLESAAQAKGFGGKLRLEQKNNGLLVTLVTDKVLFAKGQAVLQTGGEQLLTLVAQALQAVDNQLLITGYTDSDPIHTAQFPSNDELSFSRALAVTRYLQHLGVRLSRMTPGGLGERDPVAPNTTEANKQLNRRVEILVQSKLGKELLDQAQINDNAVTPNTSPISAPISNPTGAGTAPVQPNLGIGN